MNKLDVNDIISLYMVSVQAICTDYLNELKTGFSETLGSENLKNEDGSDKIVPRAVVTHLTCLHVALILSIGETTIHFMRTAEMSGKSVSSDEYTLEVMARMQKNIVYRENKYHRSLLREVGESIWLAAEDLKEDQESPVIDVPDLLKRASKRKIKYYAVPGSAAARLKDIRKRAVIQSISIPVLGNLIVQLREALTKIIQQGVLIPEVGIEAINYSMYSYLKPRFTGKKQLIHSIAAMIVDLHYNKYNSTCNIDGAKTYTKEVANIISTSIDPNKVNIKDVLGINKNIDVANELLTKVEKEFKASHS